MSKTATLTVQQWGNSLAVRIPAQVARSARFKVGQPVEVSVQDASVLVRAVGEPKLSLAQKLAKLDPDRYGGEVMADHDDGSTLVMPGVDVLPEQLLAEFIEGGVGFVEEQNRGVGQAHPSTS